jgi:hypothetical protein
MAYTLAVGTVVAAASTYGPSVNMTAVTNATEAVATLGAGHGVVVGDYLEITSGWERLNARIVRAKTVVTNDVTLESVNTISTTNYPAGSGTGTVRRITAWTNLSQLTREFSVSGGNLNFADVTTLADFLQKQIPTQRNPIAVSLPFFYDPALGWFNTINAASESATTMALRMTFPNSSKLVANGYWSLQPVPTVQDSTLRSVVDVSFASQPIVYAT